MEAVTHLILPLESARRRTPGLASSLPAWLGAARRGLLVVFLLAAGTAAADRIKDLATIDGVRNNQLVGYGLVIGLDASGDQTTQTPFTVQSVISMLKQLGVSLPADANPQLKNVAAVMVHANLPPFSKPGQEIDVTVSSIGNAKSLRGGSLLMTPLKGADGEVYALAQGNLIVGGFSATGSDGSKISVNTPTVGRVPNGATVEKAPPDVFGLERQVVLNLRAPDFSTAQRMADAINTLVGEGTANPMDATSVRVAAPQDPGQKVAFLAALEELEVDPAEAKARVIINSRTGTVVINRHVRVTEAAISHGNLIVTIKETTSTSQPGAFSGGETKVTTDSAIDAKQEETRMFLFAPGVSLSDLVRAVNEVGAAPGDLVAILESLEEVGALRAELIVI